MYLFTTRKYVTPLLICEKQNLFTPSKLYGFPPELDGFENSWLLRFQKLEFQKAMSKELLTVLLKRRHNMHRLCRHMEWSVCLYV